MTAAHTLGIKCFYEAQDIRLKALKPLPPEYPTELVTLGDHLRKARLDRGLLQQEVADELGVDPSTIQSWENNRTQPVPWNAARILRFLGYVPDCLGPEGDFPERLRFARAVLGLRQRELAARLGVNQSTVSAWENGEIRPLAEHRKRLKALLKIATGGPVFDTDEQPQ